MILDRIENWALYFEPNSRVGRAVHWLTHRLPDDAEPGRIDIDGEDIFAIVESYDSISASETRFEAHRRYLDIQYVRGGAEIIGWAPLSTLKEIEPYSQERDVAFYEKPEHYTTLELFPGSFGLFYPNDGHMPRITLGDHRSVQKVVVKVRV